MSWGSAALGDAFEFIRNGMNIKQRSDASGLPITRIETISDGTVNLDRVGYANLTEADVRKWLLQEGDILFSHINSVEHIGKCAIFEESETPLVHGMNLLAMRPKASILFPRYAMWAMKEPMFKARIMRFVNKAVNQASISTTNLKSVEIPLPPLPEQKRIAAILDQADALRRLRARALDKLNSLGQAIFHEMFGSVQVNLRGFERVPLGRLIKVSSGQGLTAKQMKIGPYPVYGGNGINGYHDEGPNAPQTIVIGRVGAYCGAVHVTETNCWITDNALLVKKLVPVNTAYLATALRVAELNQYAGRAAQPLVSGSRIYPIEILLPPDSMQIAYEEKLLEAGATAELLKASASKVSEIFTSLQHRAFRGEL